MSRSLVTWIRAVLMEWRDQKTEWSKFRNKRRNGDRGNRQLFWEVLLLRWPPKKKKSSGTWWRMRFKTLCVSFIWDGRRKKTTACFYTTQKDPEEWENWMIQLSIELLLLDPWVGRSDGIVNKFYMRAYISFTLTRIQNTRK